MANVLPLMNTPYRCIRNAMVDAGLLGRGRDPNSDHLMEYFPRLQDLFNRLQTKGIKLWLEQDFLLQAPVLQAGVPLYSFGPTGNVVITRPTRIKECYFQDISTALRPLIPLSRNEWNLLGTHTIQGEISQYYVDKQQFTTNLYPWLVPDAEAALGIIHVIIQNQVTSPITLVDTMNFPQEWFDTLEWNLAEIIATGQPQAVIDRCTKMADKTLEILEDWDVEDASIFIQPDPRSQYMGQRFQ
jgi:hypothetical protein